MGAAKKCDTHFYFYYLLFFCAIAACAAASLAIGTRNGEQETLASCLWTATRTETYRYL